MQLGGRDDQPIAVVVGASGILAPTGVLLTGLGFTTWGISRAGDPAGDGWSRGIALDCQDAVAVGAWMASCPRGPELLVAYTPAVADAVWPQWGIWADQVVVVATSKWGAPAVRARPWDAVSDVSVLQLGWRDGGDSSWHSAEEISIAVVEIVIVGRPNSVVLGSIRPWNERPG